jgi:hypothetical protein
MRTCARRIDWPLSDATIRPLRRHVSGAADDHLLRRRHDLRRGGAAEETGERGAHRNRELFVHGAIFDEESPILVVRPVILRP